MTDSRYDVITIGGGMAAAARALAENGVRVLVVERDREFKDRVRGEQMQPWIDMFLGPAHITHRGLSQTTVRSPRTPDSST